MTAPLPAQVVTETAYKRFIGRLKSSGWNSSSHFAEIDFGEGRETSVVKLLYLDHLWPQAGNEAIGFVLAKVGELPAPEKAAILVADAAWLAGMMGSDYPDDAPHEGDVLAWCASLMPHLKNATWTEPEKDQVLLAALKSDCGPRIAAFDIWLCNADRNAGNLLRLPGGTWAVIDHEMIFMTKEVRGDWRAGPIDDLPGRSTLLDKARAFHAEGTLNDKQLSDIESRMIVFADAHAAIAAEAAPRLGPLLQHIYQESDPGNVLRFIQNRAPGTWMRDQLNRLL